MLSNVDLDTEISTFAPKPGNLNSLLILTLGRISWPQAFLNIYNFAFLSTRIRKKMKSPDQNSD